MADNLNLTRHPYRLQIGERTVHYSNLGAAVAHVYFMDLKAAKITRLYRGAEIPIDYEYDLARYGEIASPNRWRVW